MDNNYGGAIAVIPKGTVITGNIETKGRLEMYGEIRGNITSTDALNIEGDIFGDIHASEICMKEGFCASVKIGNEKTFVETDTFSVI